jgi:hypothetical protein
MARIIIIIVAMPCKVPILKRVGEETLRGVATMLILMVMYLLGVVWWLLRGVSIPYMMNTMTEVVTKSLVGVAMPYVAGHLMLVIIIWMCPETHFIVINI